MASNTSFLPVHIYHLAIEYRLPILFIKIWKVFVTSTLFIAYWSYIQYSSPSLSNLSFSFFTWFSHLYFMLWMRVPKFLCSVAFLTGSICWGLFLHWIMAIGCSGAFLSTYAFMRIWTVDGNRYHPPHVGGPSLYLPTLFVFSSFPAWTIPYHFLSFIVKQDVYTSLPQKCFTSSYSDNDIFSVILGNHLCLWMSVHLILIKWNVVLISVLCFSPCSPVYSYLFLLLVSVSLKCCLI